MSTRGASFEQSAIEAILKDNSVYYTMGLELRDFRDSKHRAVFKVLAKMIGEGVEATEISVCDYAPEISASQMSQYHPVASANAEYYADGLKARTRKRELVSLATDLGKRAAEERDTRAVIDFGTTELLRIAEHRDVSFHRVGEYLLPVLEQLEAAYHNKGTNNGIRTGYYDFDELAGGLQPGQLVIIAARTSIGKTTLALNMAEHMTRAGKSVAFFSCEMSHGEMVQRLLSAVGGVDHARIAKSLLTAPDFARMTDASAIINELELWLDDTPAIHWTDLRNRARVLKMRGVDCVFIDYLTLIRYGEVRAPRHERIGLLTQEIKALARELEVPMVVMSQLNRNAEHSDGKERKPSLADLRQSGEIEENADIVMLLDRDRDDPDKDADLHIAKYRGGPTRHVALSFDAERVRFLNAVNKPGGKT